MMLRGHDYSSNPYMDLQKQHKREKRIDGFLYSTVVGLFGFGCGVAFTVYILMPYWGFNLA